MKKRVLFMLIAGALAFSLCACGGSNDSQDKTEQVAEYGIGDTWVVDGQWELTITNVTETNDRNEFSEKKPAGVFNIDYTYKNIGYEDDSGIMSGLYIAIDEQIIDSASNMGYSYPGNITSYPQETPVGATCNAQACVGVDNAGSFKLNVSHYDGNGNEQKAVFNINLAE
ncbi:MAG: hypothetical protein ACLVAE_10200 [Evtepia gabavorous]|uniref:hypothetical protein n=1 Tax=Evtepia gabavorous TaxID=2211183 RepID=UPI0039997401